MEVDKPMMVYTKAPNSACTIMDLCGLIKDQKRELTETFLSPTSKLWLGHRMTNTPVHIFLNSHAYVNVSGHRQDPSLQYVLELHYR